MTGRLHVKKGYYYIILNYKSEAGKYKAKWVSTGLPERGNKRKAAQRLREVLQEYEDNQAKLFTGMPMSDLLDDWLAVKKTVVRPNSWENYRATVETQVRPYFNELGLSIQELQPAHIQKYYTVKCEGGLSRATLDKHHTIIKCSLDYAIETLGVLKYNPAEKVVLPRKEKRVPTFYDEQQLKTLFKVMEGESIEAAVRLSATYGLRRSEVLGLRWSSVDFGKKTIVVQHTAVRCGHQVIYDDLVKTGSSLRTLPLTADMELYLKRLRQSQRCMQELSGSCYDQNAYLCKWEDGKPLDPAYVSARFRKLLKDNGLPKIRFHDLRHSSASLLINMSFTLKEVQEWLGHGSIASTNIYAHLLYKSKEGMAEKVNAALQMEPSEDETPQIRGS
ncbi:MAG: tyrosine-type recombinase/integrase [Oscillospiraceae bacterium]